MSLERDIDHWGNNPDGPINMFVAAMDSSLDGLLATDPDYWSTAQKKIVLAWLERSEARQAALKLRVLAVAGDIAEETGDKDASAWMRAELLVDKASARSQIKLAATVSKHELVAAGLASGEVSQDKVRVITKALGKIESNPVATAEDLVLAEKLLVDYATRLTANELRVVGRRILREVDPARFEDAEAKALLAEEERAHQKTALRVWDNHDGTIGFDGVLPVSIGARFMAQVHAYAQPRKQQLVDKGAPLPPWERLMGQGFARLLESIDPDSLPRHGGDATVVNVVISLEELRKELGTATLGFDETNGTTISAAEARQMACNAAIIPWVLGNDGQVLDAGRSSRFFHPIQRKALRLQQKCCQAEGCDMPPEWCDAHHLVAWALGGKTDLKDGVLLCPRHHRRAHAPPTPMNGCQTAPSGSPVAPKPARREQPAAPGPPSGRYLCRHSRTSSVRTTRPHARPTVQSDNPAPGLPHRCGLFPTLADLPHAPEGGDRPYQWGNIPVSGEPHAKPSTRAPAGQAHQPVPRHHARRR